MHSVTVSVSVSVSVSGSVSKCSDRFVFAFVLIRQKKSLPNPIRKTHNNTHNTH